MIIWGWRTITHSAKTGDFHCPECADKKPYTHQKIRRWFTLYFIPIIPLNVVAEQVKCKQCGQAWKMSVLEHDPEKAQAEQLKNISADWFNALAALVGSVGKADQQVGEVVVADIASATGWQYVANDFMAKAIASRDQGVTQSDVLARLGNLSATLSSSGKELFLGTALWCGRSVRCSARARHTSRASCSTRASPRRIDRRAGRADGPCYSLPSLCFCSFTSSYWMNQPIICRHKASASSGGRPFSTARARLAFTICTQRLGMGRGLHP
jgi:hypothetical protein